MTDKAEVEVKESKPQDAPVDRILLGRHEAAAALGISPRTVDLLIRRGELKPRRIGSRVLFLRSSLEAFARRRNA